MDDVEAARAEPEVLRLGVDDDLVADLDLADERLVGPRRATLAADLDVSGSIATTMPRRSFSISSLRPPRARRSPRRPRASRRSAARRRSPPACGWPRSRWRAARTRTRGRRARSHRCRRRSRPRAARCPQRSSAAAREPHGGRARRLAVAAKDLGHVDVDVAAVLARRPGAGVEHRRDRRRDPLLVERARLAPRPGSARRPRWRRVPPSITPTFAVVSSSSRPSLIAPIAAAAASIAERPSSGRIPACASIPSNSAISRWWVGAAVITSPIGVAWSSTKPNGERSAPRSSSFAPRSPSSSATVNTSSSPDRGRAGDAGARRARPGPRPPPCRRRRGSSRRGCERRRRRARPRSARSSGPCRGGRRTSPSPPPLPAPARSGCRRPARAGAGRLVLDAPRPRARAARRARRRRPRARRRSGSASRRGETKRSRRRPSSLTTPMPRPLRLRHGR